MIVIENLAISFTFYMAIPLSSRGHSISSGGGTTAVKRLMAEYKGMRLFHSFLSELTRNPPDGITAGPISDDNMLVWEALISGPPDTSFEGGLFPAVLTFPKDYPLSPPTMKFTCKLFHPNSKTHCKGMTYLCSL